MIPKASPAAPSALFRSTRASALPRTIHSRVTVGPPCGPLGRTGHRSKTKFTVARSACRPAGARHQPSSARIISSSSIVRNGRLVHCRPSRRTGRTVPLYRTNHQHRDVRTLRLLALEETSYTGLRRRREAWRLRCSPRHVQASCSKLSTPHSASPPRRAIDLVNHPRVEATYFAQQPTRSPDERDHWQPGRKAGQPP